jgi:hypothetical protein
MRSNRSRSRLAAITSAAILCAFLRPAYATTPPDFDKTIARELGLSKGAIFYSACDYGASERMIWLFSTTDGVGFLMTKDRISGEGIVLRQFEVFKDGTIMGGDLNFGTWMWEKYADGPGRTGLLADFPDRIFRIALPGADFIAAIMALTDIEQCEVQPKAP